MLCVVDVMRPGARARIVVSAAHATHGPSDSADDPV
jgi:hypothetical protein